MIEKNFNFQWIDCVPIVGLLPLAARTFTYLKGVASREYLLTNNYKSEANIRAMLATYHVMSAALIAPPLIKSLEQLIT